MVVVYILLAFLSASIVSAAVANDRPALAIVFLGFFIVCCAGLGSVL